MRCECLCHRWHVLIAIALLAGCGGGPSGIDAPEWDPAAATERAFAQYDANGDRKLSREELQKCPGLLSGTDHFDSDRDTVISDSELISQLQEDKQNEAALVEVACLVTRGGQPVEGATVEFVPESFLGDRFKPASGVTDSTGTAFPTVDQEELPIEYRGRVNGVHCGIYRVVVTHPTVAIPEKYNTETELGRIVTRRDRDPVSVAF